MYIFFNIKLPSFCTTKKNDILKITIIHSNVEIYLQYKKITMFYSKNCHVNCKDCYVHCKNCYVQAIFTIKKITIFFILQVCIDVT